MKFNEHVVVDVAGRVDLMPPCIVPTLHVGWSSTVVGRCAHTFDSSPVAKSMESLLVVVVPRLALLGRIAPEKQYTCENNACISLVQTAKNLVFLKVL